MKKRNGTLKQFVICVDNSGYPASLELHKIYTVLPDKRAAEDDYLRVIDESGEDYLYAAKRFVPVNLPEQVKSLLFGESANRKCRLTRAFRRHLARKGRVLGAAEPIF